MEGHGVIERSEDESGTSVKDGGAALESEVLAISGCGEFALPETEFVDILEGDEGFGVELGLIKTPKRDLTIVGTIGKPGNLIRRDCLVDQSLLRKRLNRCRNTLVGNGGLG